MRMSWEEMETEALRRSLLALAAQLVQLAPARQLCSQCQLTVNLQHPAHPIAPILGVYLKAFFFFLHSRSNSILTRSGCWQSERRSTLRFSPPTTTDLLCIQTPRRLNHLKCYLIVATSMVPHLVMKYIHTQKPLMQVAVDWADNGQKNMVKTISMQRFNKTCRWFTWSGQIYFLQHVERHKETFWNVSKFWNISF